MKIVFFMRQPLIFSNRHRMSRPLRRKASYGFSTFFTHLITYVDPYDEMVQTKILVENARATCEIFF